jgi:Pyridoxamine 5'-phosphate oxidase
MSIPVRLDDLTTALADYPFGYLMTAGPDGRPHAVTVSPRLSGATLTVDSPGRRTFANASDRPAVAMVFPPATPDGYSLIVDGEASGRDGALAITPVSAVLHRAAQPGSERSATGCGSDCHPVTGQSD